MDKEAQRFSQRPALVRNAVLRNSDLLWQAEFFRQELEGRSEYERFLRRVFGARLSRGNTVFSHLVRLKFRHFITTNYDILLEDALRDEKVEFNEFDWTNRQECRDFFLRYLSAGTPPFVIHIHGRYDQPDKIILTHRDYVARYVSSPEYIDKLSVLFATVRLVFIGFSLDDPDLKYILRQVNSRFGVGDVQNYAILGFSRELEGQTQVERERMERQFGIMPIFYDDANGHAALANVLRTMQPATNEIPTAIPIPCTLPLGGVPSITGLPAPIPCMPAFSPPIPRRDDWNSDPNKGRFGGSPEHDGRRLRAHDHREEENGMHSFKLSAETAEGASQLTGKVLFFLHPTFAHPLVEVEAENGQATLDVRAYGAFTAGALCEGRVQLELDLSQDQSLPASFRAV